MNLDKIIKRCVFITMCALILLSHRHAIAASPTTTKPIGNWLIVTGGNKAQTPKACLVARNFDSGVMLAITKHSSGHLSLGFNFRKDVFDLKKTHYTALSTEGGYNKLYQTKAKSMQEIILDLPVDKATGKNPLQDSEELYLNIQGLYSYRFDIADMNKGLNQLNECLAKIGTPAEENTAPKAPTLANFDKVYSQPKSSPKGLTPNAFNNVLNDLTATTTKSTPIAAAKLETPDVMAANVKPKPKVIIKPKQSEPELANDIGTVSSDVPATSEIAEPSIQGNATTLADMQNPNVIIPAKGEQTTPALPDKGSEKKDFAYTPPAFFADEPIAKGDEKSIIANAEEIPESDPLTEEAVMDNAVPGSIEEMEQRMQAAKEGKLLPLPGEEPQDTTVANNENGQESAPRAEDTDQPKKAATQDVATMIDPELVESLVQKIKLLEREKESLRDRLYDFEVENPIINQIKPE